MNNSVVEDLPEEFPVEPVGGGNTSGNNAKSPTTPKNISPIKMPSSSISPITNPRISQLIENSTDSRDPSFSLNLSKITERTEYSESRNQSVLDTTFTVSGGDREHSFLTDPSGVHIEFESSAKSFKKSSPAPVSFYGMKSSTPRKRSVFSYFFSCLFPFCRF